MSIGLESPGLHVQRWPQSGYGGSAAGVVGRSSAPAALALAFGAMVGVAALFGLFASRPRRVVRDYYRYQFVCGIGGRVWHRGITKDPASRERAFRVLMPEGRLRVVGSRVSKKAALAWERDGGRRF